MISWPEYIPSLSEGKGAREYESVDAEDSMARLSLTSDHAMHLLVLETERTAGYEACDEVSKDSLWLAVHRKRRFPVQNYKSFPNGDFVACAGTLIYKGRIGENALEQLYDDFSGDVEGVRQNALGNYMIAIKQGSTVFVFVDKYEVLKAYYYTKPGIWVIANSLRAVAVAAHSVGAARINELALVEKAFTGAILGSSDTLFRHIRKMLGYEYLQIDLRDSTIQVIPIPYSRRHWHVSDRTIDQLAEEFASSLRDVMGKIAEAFSDIRVMSTGGVDNRLLLAGLLSVGARPGLIHGVGDSTLASTTNEDLEICKAYAARFGLDLHVMNWRSEKEEFAKHWDRLFRAYGFYGMLYGGSRSFFREFDGAIPGNPDCILPGYFGETIRCRDWLERYKDSSFTIDWLLDRKLDGAGLRGTLGARYTELREYMRQQLLQHGDRIGLERDGERYPVQAFYILYDSLHRRDADVITSNAINFFCCSLVALSSYNLHELSFDLPLEYRKDDRFILKVIEKLDSRLLDIPFYSHGRTMGLDRNTFRLRPTSPAVRASELLRYLGLHGTQKALRRIWLATVWNATKLASEDRESRKLRKQIESIIYREQKRANIEPFVLANYDGQIGALVSYAACLYHINRVTNEGAP